MRRHSLLFFGICFSFVHAGCGKARIEPPAFSGEQAMKYLEAQVAFGPRVPGSEAWLACREYLVEHFRAQSMTVDSQQFTFVDPYSGNEIELFNILASYRGRKDKEKGILFAAHWDSRPRCDNAIDKRYADSAVTGANDGASGTAVIMELARMFRSSGPEANIDLLLVDGEDWGKAGDNQWYLLGSRHFASMGLSDKYRFAVVIDLVGDSSQQIYREAYSDRFVLPVNDYLFQTAGSLGLSTFIDSVKHTVLDDHLALNSGGIPSVVLIDFDYPYWHTEEDSPDKCSAESLANVGKLLAFVAYNPSTWPEL